jgi:hypothetical protein
MSCFEIYLNNKKICKSGIKGEGVLTSIIDCVKRENEDEKIQLHAGGLDSGYHYHWINTPLSIGDQVLIKILEDSQYDEPIEVKSIESDELLLKQKLEYFYRLKAELKDYLN